jgi:RNA polymerase sigma factor (sigma-70 family)
MIEPSIEDLLRRLAPRVLGAVVRRYGHFDTSEDAVQEALLAAAQQWPADGVPDRPEAWLIRVASRRLINLLRAEQARRRREDTAASWVAPHDRTAPPADADDRDGDDTLVLLMLCCHPSLSQASQMALTLRAVGGLSAAEIGRAFLTSTANTTRRITRAKHTIQASGIPFRLPPEAERAARLETVLHVLYLIFTEGYAATTGPDLRRPDLAAEAIRLAETVHSLLPDDAEVAGLLALMLLTDARAPARTTASGELVPIREQDRTLWKHASIKRGVDLVTRALPRGPVGPYQLQAAIAALHDEAPSAGDTDWQQIAALYRLLLAVSPGPVARLNHAVAVAMTDGPAAGLALLETLADDPHLTRDHRLHAARAHLLETAGDGDAARTAFARAARLATNPRHARYLNAQANRLRPPHIKEETPMPDEEIHPYRIAVSDEDLADLHDRIARTRWAPEPVGGDTGYGVPVARVRELAEYWRDHYDWRRWEARLDSHPQFTTTIDGANVHFLHVRSPEPVALPLVLSHGWPGSVVEYLDVIGPLSDPRRHGLDPAVAFDLVVPSLPGFGFSGPTPDTGWGPRRIARAWAVLMQRIGYQRYGTVGNDWGSFIAPEIGRVAPERVVGAHVTQAWCAPPDDDPGRVEHLSAKDRAAWDAFQNYVENEASYGVVQAQQPQTLAHALADSPVGLLGWNAQAMHEHGLDDETILTHATIHWLTGTGGSAIRIYAEEAREEPPLGPSPVPLGVAQFPGDLGSVRAFAQHHHTNIVSWNEYDRGGHYAAHDAPDLLVADIRRFFATLRPW